MVATPAPLLAGVKLKDPEGLGLRYETVGFGMMLVSLDEAVIVSACDSLVAPELIPVIFTICWPDSSVRTRLPIGSSAGGSFTAPTMIVNVRVTRLLDAPPSLTVTVIRADPD